MTPEDLLTVQEFADLIRVHPMSIYRRIREHRQAGVHRFGRDIRIHLETALQPSRAPVLARGIVRPALGGLFKGV